jgi:hypothetical protein
MQSIPSDDEGWGLRAALYSAQHEPKASHKHGADSCVHVRNGIGGE